MKIIVSKGWEGFADRLQCLSYCVLIAKRFNRLIYVDWNDTIWDEGFQKYFYFTDLPQVVKLSKIPKQKMADVYPAWWRHKLVLPANEWVYDIKDQLEFKPAEGTHFEDIWVHSGIGYREWNVAELCKHLRLQDEVKDQIPLVKFDLPLVHLRGMDREFKEYHWEALRKKAPVAAVISDDATLVERWMKESPDSMLISKPVKGYTHKTLASKHKSNIALLTEFMALAEAKEAYALNEESLFFKMARITNTKLWREE